MLTTTNMTIELVGEIRIRRWKQRSSAKLKWHFNFNPAFFNNSHICGMTGMSEHKLRVRPFERLRYKFHTLAENLSDKMVYLDSRSNSPKLIKHTFSVHLFQKRSLSKVQEFSEVQIIRINQPMNIVRTIPDPLRDYGSYIPVTIFTYSPIRKIKYQKLREFLTSQKLIRLK